MTIVPMETPGADDRSRIGGIRLDDYMNAIIDGVSSGPEGKNRKKIAIAHSVGGIALLKAIEKAPSLFGGVDVILLSSVSPKGIMPVFNVRVFLGFFSSMLKAFPVWGKAGRLDPFFMKWLLTDKRTFSEAERNQVNNYLQPYVSGSMGIELLLEFDSLKVDLDKVKKTIGSIVIINTTNDKFGDTRKMARELDCLYVELDGAHFSYFAGTQVDRVLSFT